MLLSNGSGAGSIPYFKQLSFSRRLYRYFPVSLHFVSSDPWDFGFSSAFSIRFFSRISCLSIISIFLVFSIKTSLVVLFLFLVSNPLKSNFYSLTSPI